MITGSEKQMLDERAEGGLKATHEGVHVQGRQSDYAAVTGTAWLRAPCAAFNLPHKMD